MWPIILTVTERTHRGDSGDMSQQRILRQQRLQCQSKECTCVHVRRRFLFSSLSSEAMNQGSPPYSAEPPIDEILSSRRSNSVHYGPIFDRYTRAWTGRDVNSHSPPIWNCHTKFQILYLASFLSGKPFSKRRQAKTVLPAHSKKEKTNFYKDTKKNYDLKEI